MCGVRTYLTGGWGGAAADRPCAPSCGSGFSPNGISQQKPRHYRDMARAHVDNAHHPRCARDVPHQGRCCDGALGAGRPALAGPSGRRPPCAPRSWGCSSSAPRIPLGPILLFKRRRRARCALPAGAAGPSGRLARPARAAVVAGAGCRRHHLGQGPSTARSAGALCRHDPGRAWRSSSPAAHQRDLLPAAGSRPRPGPRQHRLCGPRATPSTLGLIRSASPPRPCSLRDVIESVWSCCGAPAHNQPAGFGEALDQAKRNGTRVVVNPFLEPGLERYWVPSSWSPRCSGTCICDLHVPVRPGGDIAPNATVLRRSSPAGRSTTRSSITTPAAGPRDGGRPRRPGPRRPAQAGRRRRGHLERFVDSTPERARRS